MRPGGPLFVGVTDKKGLYESMVGFQSEPVNAQAGHGSCNAP